jgi:hypothetical protein
MPNGYAGNSELAARIRSEPGVSEMFGQAIYKNDVRDSGE